MSKRSIIGKAALALGLGVLAILIGVKVADDRHVDELSARLERPSPRAEVFSDSMVAGLPDPARRYFLHAIKPGTPIASRVRLTQQGAIRPSPTVPWLSFTATQVLTARDGFVWMARAGMGPLFMDGTDYYAGGQGRMRFAMLGLIPVVNATGPDLSRSALGRFAGELMWLPSAYLPGPDVAIAPVDDTHFKVTVTAGGEDTPLTLEVDGNGRLTGGTFPRYGNVTDDGDFQYIPFGSVVEEEGAFGGYTVPTRLRAGWWFGTERYLEFIRFASVSARYE